MIRAKQYKPVYGRTQYSSCSVYAGTKAIQQWPKPWNIATGVHAHPTVNVDTAYSVGAAILKSMEGKTSDQHTFRRKDQVVTLGPKSYIKIDGEKYWLINSSSSKDWTLLHIHHVNWSWPSSTNYAATHQICLIPLPCSDNHTSQPLLMPFGFFLDQTSKPMSQIKTVDMSWTGSCNNREDNSCGTMKTGVVRNVKTKVVRTVNTRVIEPLWQEL